MFIQKLSLVGVRNLSEGSVALHPRGNLFFGLNGSGKTSLLEAVHLLAVGRSFRSHTIKPVIAHGRDDCLVNLKLERNNSQHSLGMQRSKGGDTLLRLDGVNVNGFSTLAQMLPTVLLDTESLDLVYGPPDTRRRYLDGTLFHVEHGFLDDWRRYQRALKQRNSGLRHGRLATDDGLLVELARTGERLTRHRAAMAERLSMRFTEAARELSPSLETVDLVFRPGWDAQLSLDDALARVRDSDVERRFTQVGPHRADCKIRIDGRLAVENLSRGQAKLVLTALKLAQGRALADAAGKPPVYLVDDVIAELDVNHSRAVCRRLAEEGGQVLMTAVDRDALTRCWPDSDHKLFHVEQGDINELR